MKLILSRKGFDSQSGGCPSPIFPDGTLYSLPIPDDQSEVTYGNLWHGDTNIGKMVKRSHRQPDWIQGPRPLRSRHQSRCLSTPEGLATPVWSVGRSPRSFRQPGCAVR